MKPVQQPTYSQRRRRSSFIRLFDKTPPGIVCPHFWLLAWADGCPYECSYCYLQGTFRGRTAPVVFTNIENLLEELNVWLSDRGSSKVLNSGELTDSLAIRTETIPRLIERFGEQRKHKLLLLTKSDAVDSILNLNHNRQTIASFSLNSVKAAEKFEVGAPNPQKRLKAARKCGDAGYPVRVRVDPMLPHDCWDEAYDRLADEINELHPERVTLGTLRYFPIVKSYSRRDRAVFNFPTERSIDRRIRLTFTLRIKIYKHMLRRLKVREVSLCKETVDVVKTLGLPQKCNCVP